MPVWCEARFMTRYIQAQGLVAAEVAGWAQQQRALHISLSAQVSTDKPAKAESLLETGCIHVLRVQANGPEDIAATISLAAVRVVLMSLCAGFRRTPLVRQMRPWPEFPSADLDNMSSTATAPAAQLTHRQCEPLVCVLQHAVSHSLRYA